MSYDTDSQTDGVEQGATNDGFVHEIEDVESYVQRRRLQELLDARKRYRESKVVAMERQANKRGFTEENVAEVATQTLKDYIREIRPIALNNPEAAELWENEVIASFEVPPPNKRLLAWDHYLKNNRHRKKRDLSEMPPGYTVKDGDIAPQSCELVGLRSLLNTPLPLTYTWKVRYHIRFNGFEDVTHQSTHPLPIFVLDRYYDVAGELAARVGLDVGLDESDVDADPF